MTERFRWLCIDICLRFTVYLPDHVFLFLMRVLHKILIHLIVIVTFLILFYAFQTNDSGISRISNSLENWTNSTRLFDRHNEAQTKIQGYTYSTRAPIVLSAGNNNTNNIWCIFTKVDNNLQMKLKLRTFLDSLCHYSSIEFTLHIITDNSSLSIADGIVRKVQRFHQKYKVFFHNVHDVAHEMTDIVTAMQPHFSSQPGSYYSDILFFLSLGLYRYAKGQNRGIMLDIDTKFLSDVALLFKEFDRFGDETLFGLAPELTPVYRHVLYLYRSKHKATLFGEPASRGGFPGLNSGVVLLHFDRMRHSTEYHKMILPHAVSNLAAKYSFKGHLGDQDFCTLLAMERPSLVRILSCGWNRQLCTWWRDHGYHDIFYAFFECEEPVQIYHGNCNTPIPS